MILNVYGINNGPEIADDARSASKIYIEKGPMTQEEEAEKIATARFKKFLKETPMVPTTMQVGEAGELFGSAKSDNALTKRDIDLLMNPTGDELMFLYVYWSWQDSTGSHCIQVCRWIQPPAFQPEVWQLCKDFRQHH